MNIPTNPVQVGQTVNLINLKTKAYNGKQGTVVSFLADRQRYAVKLDSGVQKLFQGKNLSIVYFPSIPPELMELFYHCQNLIHPQNLEDLETAMEIISKSFPLCTSLRIKLHCSILSIAQEEVYESQISFLQAGLDIERDPKQRMHLKVLMAHRYLALEKFDLIDALFQDFESNHYEIVRFISHLCNLKCDHERSLKLFAKAEDIIISGNFDFSICVNDFYANRIEYGILVLFPDQNFLQCKEDENLLNVLKEALEKIDDQEILQMPNGKGDVS